MHRDYQRQRQMRRPLQAKKLAPIDVGWPFESQRNTPDENARATRRAMIVQKKLASRVCCQKLRHQVPQVAKLDADCGIGPWMMRDQTMIQCQKMK